LEGHPLTPATRAALRASLTRIRTHLQRLTTSADVIASCHEAESIPTDLRRTLDASAQKPENGDGGWKDR
jgi:hypothetical protein